METTHHIHQDPTQMRSSLRWRVHTPITAIPRVLARVLARALLLAVATLLPVVSAQAQSVAPSSSAAPTTDAATDRAAARAVADSALALISRNDFTHLADLMLPEARTFSSRQRGGEWRYSSRTREEQRDATFDGRITERGFGPTVLVSGPLAVVWMPYDLYINGAWSHCGVDAFTMYKVSGRWHIATLAWSVEQPPACSKHPDGAPRP